MEIFPATVIDALRRGRPLAVFVRLDIDPPLGFWFGVNDINVGMEDVDVGTITYHAGGQLLGIPELEVLVNGVADRIEIMLSAISPKDVEGADLSTADVRGKELHIGFTALDKYLQPVTSPIPFWSGVASHVVDAMPTVVGEEQPSITWALSVGSGVTTRAYPAASLWSHAQQTALYPTDDFCKGTARLSRGSIPSWPTF